MNGRPGRCKFCDQVIEWVLTKKGKWAPMDRPREVEVLDYDTGEIWMEMTKAENHWITCPKSKEAREEYPRGKAVPRARPCPICAAKGHRVIGCSVHVLGPDGVYRSADAAGL